MVLYDPWTGIFDTTGNMLEDRTDFTADLLENGRVLFIGGFSG